MVPERADCLDPLAFYQGRPGLDPVGTPVYRFLCYLQCPFLLEKVERYLQNRFFHNLLIGRTGCLIITRGGTRMSGPGFGAGCPVILAPVVFPFGFMDRLLPGGPIHVIHFTRKNLIALKIFF